MPRINDYGSPELGSQASGLESGASLMPDGAVGRSLQNLGNQVSETGDLIYRRKAQKEVSDLTAQFADARAEQTQTLEQETRDGTVNTQVAKERLQDQLNKMNVDISTREGRNLFEKESARLGAYTLHAAGRGEALAGAAKVEADTQREIDSNSSSIFTDPTQVDSVIEMSDTSIDARVGLNKMTFAQAEKWKLEASKLYAQSAIQGYSRMGPNGPTIAERLLDSGKFDKYIDGKAKSSLQSYIDQRRSANESDDRRAEKAANDAKKKRSEASQNKNLADVISGARSSSEIIEDPDLIYDDKVATLKLADWASKEKTQVDPGVENELFRRINLPDGDPQQISSMNQLVPYVGKGITPEKVESLNRWIDNSPEGAKKKEQRRGVIDYGTAQLIKKDTFWTVDPKGQLLFNQFRDDLLATEEEYTKEGKSLAPLYNSHSPEYFGLVANKYKRSQKDIMRDTVQEMRRASTKTQVDFKPKQNASVPRLEGETIESWLKRRRGG